ncbi:Crp/Fnr family transcriptional regulator [Actinoplanes sp. NPDC089786]|uniref:Crp/Fnr family transcriptional regulator n=1 Tax=Actinoplanes sp. NPDC089786 TaxID=3155185 RepID=UPI003431F053
MTGVGEDPCSRLSARIPADDWAVLQVSGVLVHFERDQVLFRQGDAGRHVYVVLDGSVKVVRAEADGGQTLLTVRAGGDVVGDVAALDHGTRSGTVTALAPVRARMLTAKQFQLFVQRPSVSIGFTRYTVERLRQADVQRSEIAVLPVRTRLARALLRLTASQQASGEDPVIRLSQQDVAHYAGASRNAVVDVIGELRAAGIISTTRRATQVIDPEALRRVAGF